MGATSSLLDAILEFMCSKITHWLFDLQCFIRVILQMHIYFFDCSNYSRSQLCRFLFMITAFAAVFFYFSGVPLLGISNQMHGSEWDSWHIIYHKTSKYSVFHCDFCFFTHLNDLTFSCPWNFNFSCGTHFCNFDNYFVFYIEYNISSYILGSKFYLLNFFVIFCSGYCCILGYIALCLIQWG